MKNSSRLEETIARNLKRSSNGTPESSASWRTRSLNSIQESSRLKYRLRSPRSGASAVAIVSGELVTSVTIADSRTPRAESVNDLSHAPRQVEQDTLPQAAACDLQRLAQRAARG